ncbi:MAG: radical SAM protein [Lachnospiraceae bacterium]
MEVNKKLALFGAKKEAQYLCSQIQENILGEVVAFVDNDSEKQGTYINDVPVVPIKKLQQMYGNNVGAVIISAKGSYSRWQIWCQLRECGIKNIGLFKYSYSDYEKKITNLDDCIIWLGDDEKPLMTYLEYNVTDSCNLKCKGCSHFSHLFDEDSVSDYNQFSKDLEQISKKVYLAHLRLMGGEPLLHPELCKFMEVARKILPYADINIVTNGLLIPSQDKELFETMRKHDIGFHITRYIPTDQQMTKISNVLKQENISYYIENECVQEFNKILDMRGNSDGTVSQEICQNKKCIFLRNGKLFKCPIEGMIEYFAEKYGYKNIPKARGVDIYDDKLNWEEIVRRYFNDPVEMCKFCSEKGETFKWKVQTQPQKEDWVARK